MKPQQIDKTTVESNGTQGSVAFGIKSSGLHHILGILRNQLYSDKILAVVREYSCNAVDAHTQAGISERPIHVTLPNTMNPNFKVRDYGDALTDLEIQEVYAFYGESTKRNTNDQIGMLGIGSKSAFAYGDNFVIHSFIDGKKHIYNAYIDPSQLGQITKLGVEDTDEENGIEIVVPVKKDDHSEFSNRAGQLFRWFKVRPVVVGSQVDYGTDRGVLFSGENWKWYEQEKTHGYHYNDGDAVIVMGNIGYPISDDSLNLSSDERDLGLAHLLTSNLVIEANIGEVEISASREKLQYTDYTRKNIIKKLIAVREELVETINQEFKDAPSMYAAKCVYGEVFDYGSPLYRVRSLVADDLKWKGKKIEDNNFSFYKMKEDEVELHTLEKTRGYSGKLKIAAASTIGCRKNVQVIENDLGHRRGIMGRLLPLALNENKKVYVVNYKEPKAKAKLKKEIDFDAPATKLSDLEQHPLSDFEGYSKAPAGQGDNYGERNSKYSAKCFTFKRDCSNSRWDRKKSNWWSQADCDLEKGGLYVEIETFELLQNGKFKDGRHAYGNVDPCRFKNLLESLEKIGVKVPKVYAFKVAARKSIDKCKASSEWTNVWDWIKSEVEQRLEAKGLVQAYKDIVTYKEWENNSELRSAVKYILEKGLLAKMIAPHSLLAKFVREVDAMKRDKQREEIDTYLELEDHFSLNFKEAAKDKVPTHDLEKTAKKVDSKYSLLKRLSFSHWNVKDDLGEDAINYVNVIDVCDASEKD